MFGQVISGIKIGYFKFILAMREGSQGFRMENVTEKFTLYAGRVNDLFVHWQHQFYISHPFNDVFVTALVNWISLVISSASRYSLIFLSLSTFRLPYNRLHAYDPVFSANRLVEKCRNICMVMVTVIPSPYLSRHLNQCWTSHWLGIKVGHS